MPDRIEELMSQWTAERPDLEIAPMVTFGRLYRALQVLLPKIEAVHRKHGLTTGEFDVLSALRRAGRPYRLNPKALSRGLMLSSGAMTNRLDRLEAAGLVERLPDPGDRRGVLVGLTDDGYARVDAAVGEHVANEQQLLEPLSEREIDQLNRLVTKLIAPHEGA